MALAGSNERVVGILQNKPESGQTAIVRVMGVSKHIIAEALTPGELLTSTSAGKGEQVDLADEYSYGMVLNSVGADEYATILVALMGYLGKTDV